MKMPDDEIQRINIADLLENNWENNGSQIYKKSNGEKVLNISVRKRYFNEDYDFTRKFETNSVP